MDSKIELTDVERLFLADQLQIKAIKPVEVLLYEVGGEYLVLTGNVVISSQKVIEKIKEGVTFGGLVQISEPPKIYDQLEKVDLNSLDDNIDLRDLFGNKQNLIGTRVANAMNRGGIVTVGQLKELVAKNSLEEAVLPIRGIGENSIKFLKETFGID